MNWVWVAAFTVLGSNSEHGTFGSFSNRTECEAALATRKIEMKSRNKEIVGTCYVTQRKS